MAFFSEEIFSTIFLSKKFALAQVQEAGAILRAFLLGLFFFSLNKILLNIFYAMHAAWIPACIALCATVINVILNMLFIDHFQATGLAFATTISGIIQTILFLMVLYKKYTFRIYFMPFLKFVLRYTAQLTVFGAAFLACYYSIIKIITTLFSTALSAFFITKIGLWLWVGPLSLLFLGLLYISRSLCNIQLHFLK
jgi:putative peptidoglycan lipid II flippase